LRFLQNSLPPEDENTSSKNCTRYDLSRASGWRSSESLVLITLRVKSVWRFDGP
jgi:hypothetical protein